MSIISYICWLLMLHPVVYLQASNQVKSSFRFGPDSKYNYETIAEGNHKRKHHLRFYPNYSYYTDVPSTGVLPIHILSEVKINAPDDTLKLSINRESSLRTTTIAYKRKIKKGKINISDGIKWEYLDNQVTPKLIKSPRKRKSFLREYDHQSLEYSQVEQDTKLGEGSEEYIYLPNSTYKRKRKWSEWMFTPFATPKRTKPKTIRPISTRNTDTDEILDNNGVPYYEPTTTEKRKKRRRRPYRYSTTSKRKTDTKEILDNNGVPYYEPTTTEERKKRRRRPYRYSTTSKPKTDTEKILDNNTVAYEPTTTEERKKRKKKKKIRHHKHTHNHHYHEKVQEKKNWWQRFVSLFWKGKK